MPPSSLFRLVHGGGEEAGGALGSSHRAPQPQGARGLSRALPAAPGPAHSSSAWGGQGLWKLREMLTAVAVDTRVRAGRWGGGGRRGWLSMLSQPPSSPEGSPVCAPSAQQAVSHVCLEGAQFPWASTHRCQEPSPVMTTVDVPRYAQCPMEWGFRITSS